MKKWASLPLLFVVACTPPTEPQAPAAPAQTAAPTPRAVTPTPAPIAPVAAPTAAATAAPPPAAPRADGAPPPVDPAVSLADVKPRLTACYEAELAKNRSASGSVTFLVSIGPTGTVTGAEGTTSKLPKSCVECMRKEFLATKFPARGFPWTFSMPYNFTTN